MENNLATKQDINDLKRDIEINNKNLIIILGSMLVAAVSILSVLIMILNRAH
ncbi:MAG: hypothetical protein WA659_00750 [Candidatus Aquirickettsiella sp.]